MQNIFQSLCPCRSLSHLKQAIIRRPREKQLPSFSDGIIIDGSPAWIQGRFIAGLPGDVIPPGPSRWQQDGSMHRYHSHLLFLQWMLLRQGGLPDLLAILTRSRCRPA